MTQQVVLELERFLPYRLSVLSNKISQDIAQLYSDQFNLGITEWRVMAILGQQSNLSANQVAERAAMDKVAVSRAVSSLMRKKYILRQFHGKDRRRSKLRLSTKGRMIFDQVAPLALSLEQKILSILSTDEQKQLLGILDKLEEMELALKE